MLLSEVLTCVPVGDERELQGVSRKRKPFLQVSLAVFSPKCLAGRFSLGVCSTEGVFGGTAPRRAAWA